MTRYCVSNTGILTDETGAVVSRANISDTRLKIQHLAPHILTVTLPKGDTVNIIVYYSSHCWTRIYEAKEHAGHMKIMDASRPRAFCPDRYAASIVLPDLLANLSQNRLYLTPSDRNYGTYNTTMILEDGTAYTAFFTLKAHKGRFDGIRHKLRLYVESAHHRPQPENGQNVKIAVVISKALKGEKVKYFRR